MRIERFRSACIAPACCCQANGSRSNPWPRLAPENVRRMHQSLHHVVADAPRSDEAVLEQVRNQALSAMTKAGPIMV